MLCASSGHYLLSLRAEAAATAVEGESYMAKAVAGVVISIYASDYTPVQ